MIRQDEVILRAKQFIFHLDCFTCVTCNTPLHPGQTFFLFFSFIEREKVI